jgi:SET domain-containing protein
VAATAVARKTAKTSSAAKPKRYYVVRNSEIHGRGVFAARAIRKKQTIIEYRGERTTWDEANTRPASDPDNPYHTFLFGLDDGRVIDADVRGNAARWINHSCKPNCETFEDDEGRVFIAARRPIEPGEELTYDYQLTYDGKMGKKMPKAYTCRCGAKKCRGTMLGKK